MKHILLYILILCGSFSVAYAQDQPQEDPGKKEQKIQALYIAYITQELKLNEADAQKFWPLHAQFDAEVKAVKIDMAELPRQQAILDIKKRYEDKFNKILGPARTNDFYKKDDGFRKKLIEHLRKMRQQNTMNQRPNKRRNF